MNDNRRSVNRHVSPRMVALEALRSVEEEKSFANLVLPQLMNRSHIEPAHRGFITELVYGSLRWRGLLDAVIAAAAKRDISAIDSTVLLALRIGAYQALFMDAPAFAVVSETVQLVREARRTSLTGFANAVMRKITARTRKEWESIVISRIPKSDEVKRLSVRYSHPEWMVREFEKSLTNAGYENEAESGDEAGSGGEIAEMSDIPGMTGIAFSAQLSEQLARMLEADNAEPDVTLVARPGLVSIDELREQVVAASPDARITDGRWSPYAVHIRGINPAMIPAVSEGKAGVEDEGSQLAALTFAKAALKETVSARWLDLCAGPGGKTALIGSIAAQHGITVLANEPYPHRAQLVRSSTKSLPRKTIEEVIELDGREVWKKFPQTFDAVLVDVPCSGLGALRRRPEARWTKTEEDIHELATLQNQLLNSALDAVKPGGVVAYVTCSPVVEETTQVVDSVLAERSDCERLDARSVLREIAPEIPLLSSLPSSNQGEGDIHDARDVQLFEHLHGTDQMFIALIRRLGAVFV